MPSFVLNTDDDALHLNIIPASLFAFHLLISPFPVNFFVPHFSFSKSILSDSLVFILIQFIFAFDIY